VFKELICAKRNLYNALNTRYVHTYAMYTHVRCRDLKSNRCRHRQQMHTDVPTHRVFTYSVTGRQLLNTKSASYCQYQSGHYRDECQYYNHTIRMAPLNTMVQ